MWSAERRRLAPLLLLGAALVAGACNVRPLYGPAPGNTTVPAELSMVTVKPAAGRVGQLVHNELVSMLAGPANGRGGLYELSLDIAVQETGVLVRGATGEPQSRVLNLRATYEMVRRGDPEVIYEGSLTRSSSYEFTSQRFANDRAKLDAEARAARETAEEIRLRLAIFFARGQTAPTETSPQLVKASDTDEEENRNLLLDPPIETE